jgi:hypothetical protein
MIQDANEVIKKRRGRPRIHPIKEVVEGPQKRGPKFKYTTVEERKDAKKRFNKAYYDINFVAIIEGVHKYQSEHKESIKEKRRQTYVKNKENNTTSIIDAKQEEKIVI